MKLMQLTEPNGTSVYINPNLVTYVSEKKLRGKVVTEIVVSGSRFYVEESADVIAAGIERNDLSKVHGHFAG